MRNDKQIEYFLSTHTCHHLCNSIIASMQMQPRMTKLSFVFVKVESVHPSYICNQVYSSRKLLLMSVCSQQHEAGT